jgi:hypothetical protein
LRASIAAFLARLPGPDVSWTDEHLLVVIGGSRRSQVEPDGSSSLASWASFQRVGDLGDSTTGRHDGQSPWSSATPARSR